jgi:hypothetical protein
VTDHALVATQWATWVGKTPMAALALKARTKNRSANTVCRVVGLTVEEERRSETRQDQKHG